MGYYSDRDIARLLNEAGFRIAARFGTSHFRKDTVEDILQNRFYLGETSDQRKVKGQTRNWMKGNHEPIISQALFDQCQEVRRQRAEQFNRGGTCNKEFYPLSPFLFCLDCGVRWKGQKHRGIPRYRSPEAEKDISCPSEVRSVHADKIERALGDFLRELKLPDDWRQAILDGCKDDMPDYSAQRRAIEKKLKRLHRLFIEGEVPEAEYEEMRAQFKQQLDALPADVSKRAFDMQQAGELLESVGTVWDKATPEERQQIAQTILTKIYVSGGEIKAIEPTEGNAGSA